MIAEEEKVCKSSKRQRDTVGTVVKIDKLQITE
jgi:hypothetical protein